MRMIAFSLLCAGLWAQAPQAPAGDPVVFQVGDERMTRSQFDRFLELLPDNLKKEAQANGKRRMAERLVELKSLAQEAKRRQLDQKPEVKQQLALQTDNVLASVLYQNLMASSKPDDATVRKYFDDHKGEYQQIKAKHILVRFQGSRVPVRPGQKELTDTEAKAKALELRARLEKGEDFAALAKAESDDAGSGANGGDLGTFGKGQMVPEFEKAAFGLEIGKVSEPIRTQFGYHLILVTEKKSQEFNEVRAAIENRMAPEAAQKAIEQIKKGTPSQLDEIYFGKP